MLDLKKIADELDADGRAFALPPQRFARTNEDEQRIKAIATAAVQTYAATATIALMASRTPATQAKWQRELQRSLAIQSLFTDPAKWEVIAGLIWPETEVVT